MSVFNEELLTDEEFDLLCAEFGIQNKPSVLLVSRVGRPRKFPDNSVLSVRLPSIQIKRLRYYCKQNNTSVPDILNEFINSL